MTQNLRRMINAEEIRSEEIHFEAITQNNTPDPRHSALKNHSLIQSADQFVQQTCEFRENRQQSAQTRLWKHRCGQINVLPFPEGGLINHVLFAVR
jgi:hypothetical protein